MILINNIARKGTRMSHLRRISTAALALFLALTPAAAWAGPDQDKEWIVTGQHVDAPIPVWHDDTNSFSLNTINMPMEKTALWIPKAWTGTGEKDEAKSQLVVPAKRPDLAFLGAEGTVLNAAPQNPGPGNTPIWAGLGAGEIGDTDKFEGETYTLDLISVDGPGRMEMFIDNGDSVNRFLSSHDIAYRSVYNPRHTHLYTTFTQPGRYVANYKMTARSADGSAIYSSPITPLVWQVGGANPADGTIKDIEAAYNSARAERADGNAATPTLTLSHHAERVHPGDNHLTDITIDTGVATDSGRAWITVNGYFLTEAVVEGGRATVSELLGADAAAVQAIYIPGDSASARWISQAAQYSQKDTEPVTVGGGDTVLGPSNPDPAPVWNPDHLPVSSRRVDVSYDLVPGTTDQYTATVRAADPTLRATYKIEFLESKYDFSPWCSMEGTLGAGGVDTKKQDLGVCQSDPMYMRVTLRPHPLSDAIMTVAEASDVTVGEHVGLTAMLNLRDGAAAPEEPEPAPTPAPAPAPDNGGNDATPDPASSLLSDPVEIARGHLDVRLTQATGENGTTYGLAVKDDSLTAARTSVLRTLGSTTLAVAPNARFVRPASLSDASYDVLGPVGAATYVLPETQNSDIVWPGLSTEGIDYAALPEGADLTLHLAQAPAGARVAFFQGGTFGAGAKVHFDSTKGDGVVHTTEATHMHGNWVFSAPGTYRIEVGARSGERVLAEPQSITVIVRGGHHEQPAPAPGDEPVPTPSPGPSPTPEPEPTPAPAPTVEPAPAPAPSADPAPAPTVDPAPAPAPTVDPAPAPSANPAPAPTVDPAPAPAPSANPAPAPSANPAPAPSADPAPVPAPNANPAPAPSAPQGKALSRIAPTGTSGTAGGGAIRSAGGPATTSGSGSAPAASSGGSPVSAPKAAPAATPSPSAAAGSGAQSGENPQSGAPEATTYGSNDAAAAALPVAASAESSRSGGWSPYWLLLLIIPAALAGGGAGFLIRTR